MAVALSEKDPVKAYAQEELNIDMDELVSPWQAAISSLISFTLGGAVPLLAGAFLHNQQVLPRSKLLHVRQKHRHRGLEVRTCAAAAGNEHAAAAASD